METGRVLPWIFKVKYVYYWTSTQKNKIAVLIPAKNIENQIRGPVIITVVGLSIGLLLLTVITIIGLNTFVVGPLHKFVGETNYTETSNLARRIEINSRDEIGRWPILQWNDRRLYSQKSLKRGKSSETIGTILRNWSRNARCVFRT
jgi:hypothetical protein